jgi:cysteinyl-tRNA synthetase
MDDDFNTPQAFATLFEFITQSNRFIQKQPTTNPSLWKHALDIYLKLGNILTLFQEEQPKTKDEKDLRESIKKLFEKHRKPPAPLPTTEQMINTLLDIRENARKQNQWTTADQIRSDLEKIGLEIQDTQTGPVWRKKRGI